MSIGTTPKKQYLIIDSTGSTAESELATWAIDMPDRQTCIFRSKSYSAWQFILISN